MSHSLLGKDVGDVLVQFYGPHTGRNYFETSIAPQLSIQVFGADPADEVEVQVNNTLEFRGTNNSGAIGSKPLRGAKLEPTLGNDADWSTVGSATVGDGLVTVALTAEDFENAIRVIVTTKTNGKLGDGSVAVATQWN